MKCVKGCANCKYYKKEEVHLDGSKIKKEDKFENPNSNTISDWISPKIKYIPTRIVYICEKHGYEHMNDTFRYGWHSCWERKESDRPSMTNEQVKKMMEINGFKWDYDE